MPTLNHSRVTAPDGHPDRWMLVLHGIYGTGRNWGTIAKRLVEARPDWGAVLVDLRLHGGSTGFGPPHTVEAAAADVVELVREMEIHAECVLGHSFGGKVALVYAATPPEGLRQAWVIDSTLEVREPAGSAWRVIEVVRSLPSEFASRDELVDAMEEHGYPRAMGSWLAMNLERSNGGFRWRLDWDGVEAMLRDYFRTDVWGVVESPPPGLEVHVIKATESDAVDEQAEARIEGAARETGRVRLHRVEGGHWLNTDNPDAVLRLLSDGLP